MQFTKFLYNQLKGFWVFSDFFGFRMSAIFNEFLDSVDFTHEETLGGDSSGTQFSHDHVLFFSVK